MPLRRRYGWRPDRPDVRDQVLRPRAMRLPDKVDLREAMPPVYDQGELGSCTANAIAGAVQYQRRKEGLADFVPSRLFIYFNERLIEGTVKEDAGAEIRDGIKAVHKLGAPAETLWPYDAKRFAERPSNEAYLAAKLDLVCCYTRIPQGLVAIKTALAQGLPVAFGFNVYAGFESDDVATSGIMPLPQPGEECVGGHAVLAAGYDDAAQALIVRNSWGADWGKAGYFLMPYAFAAQPGEASDFWTINRIE